MKFNKVFFLLILAFIAFCSLSCSQRYSIEGKWILDTDSILPLVEVHLDSLSGTEKILAKTMLNSLNFTFDFKNDNTCTINISGMGQNQSKESTYRLEGDKIFLFDKSANFKIENNTLLLSQEDITISLTPVK